MYPSIATELKNSTVLYLEITSTVAGFELVATTMWYAMHSLVRFEVTTMRCGVVALDRGTFRPIDES